MKLKKNTGKLHKTLTPSTSRNWKWENEQTKTIKPRPPNNNDQPSIIIHSLFSLVLVFPYHLAYTDLFQRLFQLVVLLLGVATETKMTDNQASVVEDESLVDSAFLDERSNSLGKLNQQGTLKKWYREPSHRQVSFFDKPFLMSKIVV